MHICVITKVPNPEKGEDGNMALTDSLFFEDDGVLTSALLKFGTVALIYRSPVFRLGEILFLDHNDRCIFSTRKPSKWLIEYEEFSMEQLAAAIQKSQEVVDAARD